MAGHLANITINHFQVFVDQIFKTESSALANINIHIKMTASCVSWLAP